MKIPKNFYLISGLIFFVWMLFFDSNDFYSQFQLKSKKQELEEERKYYKEKIRQVNEDREALLKNRELLERFAREKYYMKKDNEEVFVVVEE